MPQNHFVRKLGMKHYLTVKESGTLIGGALNVAREIVAIILLQYVNISSNLNELPHFFLFNS